MNYKIIAVLGSICAIIPTLAAAGGVPANFEPLVGIPGLDSRNSNFDNYINALYALSISVAALIAVIQIVLGGAQYMMDDLISGKSAAKERIRNALIGLIIIIGAVLILSTLNEDLTNFTITAEPAVIDPNIAVPPSSINCSNGEDSNCTAFICNSNEWGNIPFEDRAASCRDNCLLLSGTYTAVSAVNGASCALAPSALADYVTERLNDIAGTQCPEGVTGCRAETCSTYSTSIDNISCATTCEERNGIYDNTSRTCTFSGTHTDTTIACDTTEDDGISGTGNVTSCTSARSTCRNSGGYVVRESSSNVTCRNNAQEISEEIRDSVCTGGSEYECEVIYCEAGGYSSCRAWCNSDERGSLNYNEEYNVCYAERRASNSNINPTGTINPNITYSIDSPGDSNHNQTVTFSEPLRIEGGMVGIIVNGREIMQGCTTITPNVCGQN